MKPYRSWGLSNEAITRCAFLLICTFLLVLGCASIKSGGPPKKHGYGNIDKYGCQEPPPDIFTSAGLDFDFASSTFGKIVTGEIKVQTKPEVLDLASKAVHEARIRDYLRCLAIKRDGYNLEQAAHLERFNAFLAASPTASEFSEWQKTNPFPKSDLKQIENDNEAGSKKNEIENSSGSVVVTNSELSRSPIITNSPNTHVDNSVTFNKILPEIKIDTITDMHIAGTSPYRYSFYLWYSVTMDTPASYEVQYIDLELYEIVVKEGVLDNNIFLSSIRLEEFFKSSGMSFKKPKQTVNFSNIKRIKNLKIKLVMGIEGGLTREDFRNIWQIGE